MDKTSDLQSKLENYKQRQTKWIQQKELYLKTINLMQQEITKYKAINSSLLKKGKHKRVCSEEQTFIFNQTNISSYYPLVVVKTANWNTKANLRSHLDSVRTLNWHHSYLISAGEDATLKIWQKQQLKCTIRQHLGPIYVISSNGNNIFTGGAEGVIRKWSFNDLIQNNSPDQQFDFHQEPIWDMITNEKHKILITSSADQSHKIIRWDSSIMQECGTIKIENDSPTVIDWLGDTHFISGFVHRSKLTVYDIQTGSAAWDYSFEGKMAYCQPNKIRLNQKQKMIAVANEDHYIRFYDANSNKRIKQIVAHSDSVTSLLFRPEGYQLASCGHDGNLRIWDLRKYKCVTDIAVHTRKYDQSALCLAQHQSQSLLAVGGADGLIKIMHQQH